MRQFLVELAQLMENHNITIGTNALKQYNIAPERIEILEAPTFNSDGTLATAEIITELPLSFDAETLMKVIE